MRIPKICVSFTPNTYNDISGCMEALREYEDVIDVIEWRVDYYQDVIEDDIDMIGKALQGLGKPLIFTFRTLLEGGNQAITAHRYEALCVLAAKSSYFDYVDVELSMIASEDFIPTLKQSPVQVIVSHHNFHETPSTETMSNLLHDEVKQGADLVKLAVMPTTKEDVARVVAVGMAFHETCEVPMIVIAMGELGKSTRVMGETIGNEITFGSVGKVSAPGQINARVLKDMMIALHNQS